jgi:Uma2 family endonuclease
MNNMKSPLKITDAAYEKSNRKMRSEHKSQTGKTLGKRLTSGKNKRRVSFACRFAGMAGAMKDAKGKPTRKARALKKWGFGSVEAARNFCNSNKEK